ncbi:hypothetical protein JRO89_XS07G0175400 [Xanthoceras sorbifolium]|uniref:Peptidase M20 dimerisation domain-containing protein n=1 Tax=Xanthoceras sorbifolium TaxID=99658 RepID=A0ABQ8HUA6_9ROSI|nr:hypothetical protein JRO89_XS07G0175400 [Xanthoceras sorbifolium]
MATLRHLLLIIATIVLSSSSYISTKEEEAISWFKEYLRFKTAHPNPNYTAPVSFLIKQANSIGLESKTLEFVPGKPVLLVTWPGSNPSLPCILFNSHLDSVPAEPDKWSHPPFSAFHSPDTGHIFARGAQDDKCISIQYLEAIRNLKLVTNFEPTRTVHLLYVPEEEIGGFDGMAKFVDSDEFRDLNVGFVMDEGQASTTDEFRVFYADRSPWNLIIRAKGATAHGSRMFDNGATENLMKSIETITRFRDAQFDVVKAGKAADSEVISVNPVYLKSGIPSPTGFVMNMQPSEAEAGFDVRLPPTVDPDLVKRRIAEEWAPAARNMTYLSPFVKGRQILDAVLMENEVVEECRKEKREGVVSKIDFEKAYDHVDWDFLNFVLEGKGLVDRAKGCQLVEGLNVGSDDIMIIEKGPIRDYQGRPLMTLTNDSNPWWPVFKYAITAAGGKLQKPEILASTTDARYMRQLGIPAFGFSPMSNTPILLHDHNEFLNDRVFLRGIEVYESVISSLSSFVEPSH